MPEYLAPGVYVEETTFRQKTIEGVSTSTAGFVGPTRFGPTAGEPELLTSFLDFERIYGGIDYLDFGEGEVHNDVAHAVRGFFENGGRRLYVARVFDPPADPSDPFANHGKCPVSADPSSGMVLRARWPGAAGNFTVTFTFRVGPNILVGVDESVPSPSLQGPRRYDTVLVLGQSLPAPRLYVLERDEETGRADLFTADDVSDTRTLTEVVGDGVAEVRVVTVSVDISPLGRFMDSVFFEDLSPDPRHRTGPLITTFAAEPTRKATTFVPLVIDPGSANDGGSIVEALLAGAVDASIPEQSSAAELLEDLLDPTPGLAQWRCRLAGGSDGGRPPGTAYEGDEDANGRKSALKALEDLEDISIVAAPGSSRDGLNGYATDAETIAQLLISHSERMKYRIAVLDSPNEALVSDVRAYRGKFDSKHAALYYPWITIADPMASEIRGEIDTPPSGFVAGVYARNDVERGVHKAPANEVVRLAIDFELPINKGQQDVLNPEGVNCLRFFEGRGYRIWGARTITSDPEWKYVNLRRYFAFLERSIDKGTQWAVFEPNGSALWANVRRTVEDFLFNEWKSGHLMGEKAEEAYFVKCDRSTMTQNDIDNGRLICLVGVAPLRPAEFVIFRIGQKTLDFRG